MTFEAAIERNVRSGQPMCISPSQRESSVISAAFLYRLIKERVYQERGIVIIGVTIRGELDCSDLAITSPLRLLSCRFELPLRFSRAQLHLLDLRRCVLPSIFIDKAVVTHGVLLDRATLGTTNGSGVALDGTLLRVGKEFRLEKSSITGEVDLLDANIEGRFSCRGAHLNGIGDALSMDRAEVKGSVFLNEGFTAAGTVRLPGATIGGQLIFRGAQLNGQGDALLMDGIKVKDGVYLDEGFTAAGTVRLPGATIGGQLMCTGAQLNGLGDALSMDRAEVKDSVFLPLTWAEDAHPSSSKSPSHLAPPRSRISLQGARLGYLELTVTGSPSSNAIELTSTLLLEGAIYGGLSGPQATDKVKSSWAKRTLAWARGTSELERLPGVLYRAVLVSQQQENAANAGIYPGSFTTVARVLRDTGSQRLARQLLLERSRQLTRQRRRRSRPVGWFSDITVGYGFRPQLAPLWALLVYLIATFVFAIAVHHGGIVATPLAGTITSPSPLRSTAAYPTFSAANYAFGALLLPFVHLPGIDAWRANATNGWGIVVRVLRWVEPAVLWSLLIVLGATLTTLVTRDQR